MKKPHFWEHCYFCDKSHYGTKSSLTKHKTNCKKANETMFKKEDK